jgi:hypothetical protein
MSTTDYLDKLTIDQLRFARDEADRRIKAAEVTPKKILWVVNDGCTTVIFHREEDYEKAIESYIKTLQSSPTIKWAFTEMLEDRPSVSSFKSQFACIEPRYFNEVEYEEWFK